MSRSAEYPDIEQRLPLLLVQCDRILRACDGHPEFNRVTLIGEDLRDLAAAFERGRDVQQSTEALAGRIELWLKAVLWLAVPPASATLRADPRHYTLFPVLLGLKLLTEAELQVRIDQYHTIPDQVRQLIRLAKTTRDSVTHETNDLVYRLSANLLSSTLITLLAPIYKHYDAIFIHLRGLVTSPIDAGNLTSLLRTIASERRGHLQHFAGRVEWLRVLREQLESDQDLSGRYVLLVGPEGTGKSALCARLTEDLVQSLQHLGNSQHKMVQSKQLHYPPQYFLQLHNDLETLAEKYKL